MTDELIFSRNHIKVRPGFPVYHLVELDCTPSSVPMWKTLLPLLFGSICQREKAE
jgi:hypothetical protein